jgi:hypothetical protein
MMVDDNDGRVGTDREEGNRQGTHQNSVVSTHYNKGEAYFSKPHLIARTYLCRRKNKPVASGVVEEIIQILDRNTVDTDEERSGCV